MILNLLNCITTLLRTRLTRRNTTGTLLIVKTLFYCLSSILNSTFFKIYFLWRIFWSTFIEKVFKKLGLTIKKEEIDDVIACKPLAIENLLKKIYLKVNKIRGDTADGFGSPTGNSAKDQFYRSQIVERDNQIEELRIKLEVIIKDLTIN